MKVMDIDGLCLVCGYFTYDTDANNGYGCNHPGNDEYEMLWRDGDGYTHRGYDGDNTRPKVRQGKCYPSSCPIARQCDMGDLYEHDRDAYDGIIRDNPGEDAGYLNLVVPDYGLMLVDETILNQMQ